MVRAALKIEEQIRATISKYCPKLDVYARNKIIFTLSDLLTRKEKEAYRQGYETGRWDRATNSSTGRENKEY